MRTRKHNPNRREAGFTLLELTCAAFVLTFGVMAVLQLHLTAMQKARVVQENAVADEALQNEIETLRAQPFDSLANGESLPFQSVTPALERLPKAAASVSIADADSSVPGLKRVYAQVRWTGENGRLIERRAETLIARRP